MAKLCKFLTYYQTNCKVIVFQAPSISFDHHDNDSDPSTYQHRHGTRSSGVVGAAKNDHCGVGVAYECNLGGSH